MDRPSPMGDGTERLEDAFISKSVAAIPAANHEVAVRSQPVTRSLLAGLATGATAYVVGPELTGLDRAGNSDELSGTLFMVAGALLGTIRNARHLCATEPEKRQEDKMNVATGATGGAIAGAGLVKLLIGGALAPLDGGTTLLLLGAGGAAVGAGGAAGYNWIRKKKYCPHEDCKEGGHCSQRVCRKCYRLFFPVDEKLDPKITPFLTWAQIASFLSKRHLTYLDAERLLRDHFRAWRHYADHNGDPAFIDCADFLSWLDMNGALVASYAGSGAAGQDPSAISRRLDGRGL